MSFFARFQLFKLIGHIHYLVLQEFNKSDFLMKILHDMSINKLFLAYFDTKYI